jgi:beta-N-acetylhexosaminidase
MLTLEQKVGQLMMVGFHGTTAPPHILEWLKTGRIGGVYLFSRNIETPEQLAALVEQCHAAVPSPILVGIDQEGGLVARLRDGFTESPGVMALSASDDLELTRDLSAMLARELRAMGINWNFAPVVDITHDISNPSVGTRSLGSDKDRVSRFAQAEIAGFQQERVAACAKHFPGLGNTPVDTHEALAVIDGALDYLWEQDLLPFRASVAAGVATVMVSHVLFKKLDADYPASLSPVIINGLLRKEIGFTGVVATDCMEMKAIADHYGAGESAVLAVEAGIDLVMFSHTLDWQEAAYHSVLEAVRSGRIPESRIDESVARIQAVKARFAIDEKPVWSEVIRQPSHRALAQRAARAGVVAIKPDDSLVPLQKDQSLVCIEFASYLDSDVIETNAMTHFAHILRGRLPGLETRALKPATMTESDHTQAVALAGKYDTVVLVTRNAHLWAEQQRTAQAIIDRSQHVILLCLRNPYDAQVLTGADVIFCTHGDSTPSLQAACDALCGDYIPTGQLVVPVNLP